MVRLMMTFSRSITTMTTATLLLLLLCQSRFSNARKPMRGESRHHLLHRRSDILNSARGNKDDEEYGARRRRLGESMNSMKSTPSPSKAPSPSPSVSPTQAPSISPKPSEMPSVSPTAFPTTTPSAFPSQSPTISPAPTSSPSEHPSSTPSYSPSSVPSLSIAPTEATFTQTVDANGFDEAQCITDPPTSSSTQVASYVPFDYLLYVNSTLDESTVQNVVNQLESDIHIMLAREAMTCDYTSSFALIRLSSAGSYKVDGLGSIQTSDIDTCWKVNANITTTFFYSTARRELNDIDAGVVGPLAGWLTKIFSNLAEEDDEISALQLDGFQALEALSGEEFYVGPQQDDSTTGTDQALSGNIAFGDESSNGGFVVLVCVAGVALIVIFAIVVVRRNKRRKELMKHVLEVEELSLDEEDKVDLQARSNVYDLDNDEDTLDGGPPEELFEGVEVEDANHDYRTCASPTCYICQSTLRRPVFISTEMGGGQQNASSVSPSVPSRKSNVSDTLVL